MESLMSQEESKRQTESSPAGSVGDLVDQLQAQGLLSSEKSQPESAAEVQKRLAERERLDEQRQVEMKRVVGLVGASPVELQVKFLRGLAENPEEGKKFMDDPRAYSRDHGILLDPTLVKGLSDTVLYGEKLPGGLVDRLGAEGIRDILDIQVGPGGVNAWPAAVAAVAAVVSAAAAVVTAVTAVTSDSARDILALKGLGPNGVRIPGFRPGGISSGSIRPQEPMGGLGNPAEGPLVNPGSGFTGGFSGRG